MKLRGQIATEQEKLLGDRDTELGECRDQLRDSKQLLDSVNNRIENCQRNFVKCPQYSQEVPALESLGGMGSKDPESQAGVFSKYCGHFATFC